MMKQMQQAQANAMQNAMQMQTKLAETVIEGTAGGGAVKISISGAHELKSVEISQDVVDSQDKEMLEDMVQAAFEDALGKIAKANQDAMSQALGGLQIPGMPGMI